MILSRFWPRKGLKRFLISNVLRWQHVLRSTSTAGLICSLYGGVKAQIHAFSTQALFASRCTSSDDNRLSLPAATLPRVWAVRWVRYDNMINEAHSK